MNTNTITPNARPSAGTVMLGLRRARNMFLATATLAVLGTASNAMADRVSHNVSAGYVIVSNSAPGTLSANATTEMYTPLTVNGFDIINNHNVADYKVKIGDTENDDIAGGMALFSAAEILRNNNRATNLAYTVGCSPVNADRSYECAAMAVTLAGAAADSFEDNVNFAAAWFPYDSWYGGIGYNGTNLGSGGTYTGNNQPITNFFGTPGLVFGTHYYETNPITDARANGVTYVDLRSLGIDSRRDGVLLVNGAKNENNFALSMVNDSEDDLAGTWTVYCHDNKVDGRSYESDPVGWVFVPKTNTTVISGMFMGDCSPAIWSGATPMFTVSNWANLGNPYNGAYELKVQGYTPKNAILIVSAAGGTSVNGDNMINYQPLANSWLITTRDLPNPSNSQLLSASEAVCSFIVIPVEPPGVSVTPNKNLMTTEAGGTATFDVKVTGYPKPTADITINVTSGDISEGTVNVSSLTFTPAEWNVAKTVTITGVDDADIDGTVPYSINLSSTISTESSWNGLVPGNVEALNVDNEAGISVDKRSVITTEAGGTDTFNMVLNTAPAADVTIALSSSDTTEAIVSPASLTFTPANYNIPQTVTVTGQDDFVQDGPVAYFVITAAATSADTTYNGNNPLDIQGENRDDDLARVIIPADTVIVTEPNTSASVPVVLGSQPTANVTINAVSSDLSEGTVTASITFTPANWNVPQNLVITAVDDLTNDLTQTYSIITTITSSDALYAAINPDDIEVQTIDNEGLFTLTTADYNYGKGDTAKGIDGYATVTDIDTANYNGGSLTVSIAGALSSDRLAVRSDGTGTGQISVSGSTVSYENLAFGSISGGTGTTPLTVTFNTANATPAAAQALVRAVTFQNVDAGVADQVRAVTFTLNDGHSGVSVQSKNLSIRLLRVYTFQEGGDNGFGPFRGADDCELVYDDPGNYFSEGLNGRLWVDWNEGDLTPGLTDQSEVLLRFTNVFGTLPGQIPLGSKIVKAEVIMNVVDSGHGALFNRMLTDWDAQWSSWTAFVDGVSADDVESISGTNSFIGDMAHNTTTGTGFRSCGVTADVQAWANGTNNYGWALRPWIGGANGTGFSPCESTNLLIRPKLRVTWVPATVASATFAQGLNGYTGTEDTQVRIANPDTTYAANTTLSPDWITSGSTYLPNQVLLKFNDIVGTGAGQVPPGSTIFAAVVELTSINADAEGAGGSFNRALKSWTQADTWNTLVDGMSQDDVEAVAAPTAMLPFTEFGGNVKPTKWVVELTQDMQAWVNGAPNNGWVIFPLTNGSNGWAFNSADATVPPNTQPQLRVYFEPGVVLGMPIYNGTGSLQLPFTGVASRTYSVWRAGAINGTWTKLGTQTTSGAGAATYTDNAPLAGSAFYRVSYP